MRPMPNSELLQAECSDCVYIHRGRSHVMERNTSGSAMCSGGSERADARCAAECTVIGATVAIAFSCLTGQSRRADLVVSPIKQDLMVTCKITSSAKE